MEFDNWVESNCPNVAKWVQRLNDSDGPRKFFLHACRREFEFENIQSDTFKAILKQFDSFLNGLDKEDPILSFSIFVENLTSSDHEYIYKAGKSSSKPKISVGIRLMTRESFRRMLRLHIPDDSLTTPIDRSEDQIIIKLTKGELSSEYLSKKGAIISGVNGFFWTSRMDSLPFVLKNNMKTTDINSLLKQFGLCYSKDELVAVFFELFSISEGGPYVPTILHTRGLYQFFRPAWRKDYWGEAVNLELLAAGVPEAIKLNTMWQPDFHNPIELGICPGSELILDDIEWAKLLSNSESELSNFVRTRPDRP